jgi:ATP-binding cassette subfamily B protein
MSVTLNSTVIHHADCIDVMDKGQIVKQGNPEELMALNGIDAGLWSVQSGLR